MTVVIMVLAFYLLFTVLGLKAAKVRGDFLLFMMSGIFLYLTHIKAMGAVAGADGPASPMMQHAPMNTAISIASGALGALYIQVLSLILVLFVYHTVFVPITIYQPVYAMGMVLVAWFTGCAVGMVLLALRHNPNLRRTKSSPKSNRRNRPPPPRMLLRTSEQRKERRCD